MQYVSVSCFGNSGGSTVVDLLREYDCVQSDKMEYEHIVLADKDAVIETYLALKRERGGASDVTIRRFMEEMKAIQYYRNGVRYFSDEQRKQLDFLTKTYVDNVVSLEGVSMDSILTERANIDAAMRGFYFRSKVKQVCPWIGPLIRLRNKWKAKKAEQVWEKYQKSGVVDKHKGWYMRKTSNEKLKEHTANFIKAYLEMVTSNSKKDYFVLDHLLEMDHLNVGNEILGEGFIKTIVVIRDPRDHYVSCVSQGKDIIPFDIDAYCQYFKNCIHILLNQDKRYYHKVYFNELIENYDVTVKGIEDYLGIDGVKHHVVDVGKQLDISVSGKHNRRYLFEENKQKYGREIKIIERELSEYLQD